MRLVGIALFTLGAAGVLTGLVGAAYFAWAGNHYGWLSPQMDLMPFGFGATLLGLVFTRIGAAILDK